MKMRQSRSGPDVLILGSGCSLGNHDAMRIHAVLKRCRCATGFATVLFSLFVSMGVTGSELPFVQQVHEPFPVGNTQSANDVRCVAVDRAGRVWAGTEQGLFRLEKESKTWVQVLDGGPVYDIASVDKEVWVAAWDGLYCVFKDGSLEKIPGVPGPVTAVSVTQKESGPAVQTEYSGPEMKAAAAGPLGIWHMTGKSWSPMNLPCARSVRHIADDGKSGYWVATGMGLYHLAGDVSTVLREAGELISADVTDVVQGPEGMVWVGGLGGITVLHNQVKTGEFTPADGLPSVSVSCLAIAPDGRLWAGTDRGLALFDGKRFSVRHSRRWLMSDDVRDIAFDEDGDVWIATAAGVSSIRSISITLAEKAAYFMRICQKRHIREPGLVEKCYLPVQGDTSRWEPLDDDNDGQYTAMYLAMESFRYSATGSEEAKANAKRAFEALRFLQTVTGTDGFVARTVIPVSWKRMMDPNRTYTDKEWAEILIEDPRVKKVDKRWRPSEDGKWLWKGDTSSDEITGHMFGYLFYYDLVAKSDERKRVRDHVSRIVDHIMKNGYMLKDIDGTHTRWAVWSPEKLNFDQDWQMERGVNSVEMLSFLKLAYHVSGRVKYQKAYLDLLNKQGYRENVRKAKTTNPAWITHIDDELLSLAYPCLFLHEKDPGLRGLYLESIRHWYETAQRDRSPYFDFIFSMCTGDSPDLNRALFFFKNVPVDLVRWRVDNSQRDDVNLTRHPELESVQTERLLPPDEIALFRWDNNPWLTVQGDGGHTESDGVFWLLPYWMGRYMGYFTE